MNPNLIDELLKLTDDVHDSIELLDENTIAIVQYGYNTATIESELLSILETMRKYGWSYSHITAYNRGMQVDVKVFFTRKKQLRIEEVSGE